MFVTEFSQVQKLYNLKSYALQLNIQQKKSNGYRSALPLALARISNDRRE